MDEALSADPVGTLGADPHRAVRDLPTPCLVIDLGVVGRAFRQHDDVDRLGLVPGGGEHPVHQVQVERSGRRELEEAERIAGQFLQRPGHRAEV